MEEKFVLLCERHCLTPPAVNARVAGWTVDAVWLDLRLALELDSHAAHATPAAMEEDRRRDLELRAAGYTVLRYTWRHVTEEGDLVIADLRDTGSSRAGRPAASGARRSARTGRIVWKS